MIGDSLFTIYYHYLLSIFYMKTYLIGPPGSGKTTRLAQRLIELIERHTRPDRILVLVPQQAQANAFRNALRSIKGPFKSRGQPEITTLYGLAQRHVALFFPLVAARAGFSQGIEPTFINVELAQYFLNQLLEPRSADFDDLRLYRPRLLGQILDSMNKAAECGFGLDEIAARLGAAWSGDPQRRVSFQRAQDLAQAFRQFCHERALLDFSLLIETYAQHLLNTPTYRDYVTARYRHVIIDQIEENPPVTHDLVRMLLETCDTASIAEDDPGGYRLFLGADRVTARALAARCDQIVALNETYVASPSNIALGNALAFQFGYRGPMNENTEDSGMHTAAVNSQSPIVNRKSEIVNPPIVITGKFWSNMVRNVSDQICALVAAGARAGDIAVLAPFVEDVLYFELSERLAQANIVLRTLRPSRPLYDHPATRAMVTLAKLAHPTWQLPITVPELARTLALCLDGLDVARAQLIADAASKITTRGLAEISDSAIWERVGMRFYERYHELQRWLAKTQAAEAEALATNGPNATFLLDLFWQRLFTEVLSRAGFGLNNDPAGAIACDKLIRSARHFREVVDANIDATIVAAEANDAAQARAQMAPNYLDLLSEGIMAAQYTPERVLPPSAGGGRNLETGENAVLLAPVYAYLTSNLTSRYQFWLDVNSLGWYERIHQPLTHPYVLSRQWQVGRVWTEDDEHRARRDMMCRVLRGLTYRCSGQIFVASSQLGISGQEDSGPLVRAIQRVMS